MKRRDFGSILPGSLLAAAATPRPIPAKTVVLTFDDAVKSHRTFVGPLLKELGFNATFFVTHRWMPDEANFMTWAEIGELHAMGFEIGNHSWTHADASTPRGAARLESELALVEYELNRVKVPKPASFAWCGNTFGPEAMDVLRERGITMARRGGAPEVEYGKLIVGPAFDPARHHPLLIPTTGDGYPDWTFEDFLKVIAEAREGRAVVLQFHGVPDVAHPWVHTPPVAFRRYLDHLKKEGFNTLALRELQPFVDLAHPPSDALLGTRYRAPKDGKLALAPEVEASRLDLSHWRSNMREHGYTAAEAGLVTGEGEKPAARTPVQGPKLAPYPGGRHVRLGFREGGIAPMRGTKASLFLPWEEAGYAVIDVPEAIFANGKLMFLGHTHIPTMWDRQNIGITNRDWTRRADVALSSEWTLPNQVSFGAEVRLEEGEVRMNLWVRNGSPEPLTAMRSQVCVLLGGAPGFAAQTAANKTFVSPRASARSLNGQRVIHTEWEDCQRAWGDARCPCIHSDPKFPDCAPGETVRRAGRLWFEG